jgi:hypothetical protein
MEGAEKLDDRSPCTSRGEAQVSEPLLCLFIHITATVTKPFYCFGTILRKMQANNRWLRLSINIRWKQREGDVHIKC